MKIIVTMPLSDAQKQKLEKKAPQAEFFYCRGGWFRGAEQEKLLSEAEVILGNVKLPGQLAKAKALRWLQLNNAGTEGYCEPGVLPEGVQLTNATGAYGPAISEHMLACLFMLRKKLDRYYQNQLWSVWKSEGHVAPVEGSIVLCMGLGDIGGTFARKMKALGAYTIGIKRRTSEKPDYLDELYMAEQFADEACARELLGRADTVALSMPGNAETRRLFDEKRLSMMKETAVLLNVGRGSAVDTDALCCFLQAGKLGGAALDVTDPEPLPAAHPLWHAPNVIITPHISGGFSLPETLERIVDICADNLERYQKQEPLRNLVDFGRGYAI